MRIFMDSNINSMYEDGRTRRLPAWGFQVPMLRVPHDDNC